ncbi:MAG: glucoamylase family protein [Pirellulaceae bacterium]
MRRDPACVYSEMDLESRNRYRNEVEQLAKRTGRSDVAVADRVVQLARSTTYGVARASHIGYWLIGDGRAALERQLAFRPRLGLGLARTARRYPTRTYFSALAATLLGASSLLLGLAIYRGVAIPVAAALTAVALFPLSELAVQVVNLLVTSWLPPRLLPKLELKDGVPEELGTLVVVPAMLVSAAEVDALLERLEVHYLANPEPMLRFGLLTDYADADHQVLPEDLELLRHAVEGIRSLNQRHGRNGCHPFFLWHRERRWNPAQSRWMGWERKRGKLVEFGRLVRGATDTSYVTREGDSEAIVRDARRGKLPFVITLDADTQLPHGAARRLIGTLAHPLNRPLISPASGQTMAGYAVLQPRASVHLASANRSRFAHIFADSPGIDPYATAASDVYQDLFGEGSFTGKGIYDRAAFENIVEDAFPENHILSHDLIEGCLTRVALVSDIELIDSIPGRYESEMRRQHRWVRGDWQLLPWLLPTVPTANGPAPNRLSVLNRWKIVDNLRRSLVPPALLILVTIGWLIAPAAAWLWTLTALLVFAFPTIAQLFLTVRSLWADSQQAAWTSSVWADLRRKVQLAGTLASFLPYQSWMLTDAIVRTLYRLAVSRRRLLEWETAAATERRLRNERWSAVTRMGLVTAWSVGIAAVIPAAATLAAAPLVAAWLVAPALLHWINQPFLRRLQDLTEDQLQQLRKWARRTWGYFESFATAAENWLPPDNLQEYPHRKIAHRVSPTNEGLMLVSAVAAHDLGYLGTHALLELLERNLENWCRLERHGGHFYNWYDTQSLTPLFPRYVSTVDSGNLLACLLVVQQALEELPHHSVDIATRWQGLLDTVDMAEESCEQLHPRGARIVSQPLSDLVAAIRDVRGVSSGVPAEPADWDQVIQACVPCLPRLTAQLETFEQSHEFPATDVAAKVQSLIRWIQEQNTDRSYRSAPPLEKAPYAPREAVALDQRCRRLIALCQSLATGMDFRFLFNPQRRLFAIGYNVEDERLDRSHYDLLCSEARLASYLAIAKGDVEARHWFQLSRSMTRIGGQFALLSWGGTMFEYLMPALFHKPYERSLLTESCQAAVARQREYGEQLGVPWGISESAFAALAANSDYHYRSFGVPGLGLKRGLAKDVVVSPYSTFMALQFDAAASWHNLALLRREGALGPWGFYDALDYTQQRVPSGQRSALVRCYMAHHHGMSLLALSNFLGHGVMQQRFHRHPLVRAAELLLQERVPATVAPLEPHVEESATPIDLPRAEEETVSRRITGVETLNPRTHLLANGQYSVLVTNSGSGYSHHQDLAVTRWRADATQDEFGHFLYLRDRKTQRVWSATYQPTSATPDSYEVVYSIDKAEFHRRDEELESHLEIVVSPEHNAEIRQLKITNHGVRVREIEITSYAEVVLASQAADVAHPAFAKLFVETEYVAGEMSLLARRRPRGANQSPVWAIHTLAEGNEAHDVQFETSRQAFVGRGRSLRSPLALSPGRRLTGQLGAVLDPVFSLRCCTTVPPHESVTLAWTTAVAATRDEAMVLADQYHDFRGVQRAFELAWAFTQVQLRHLQISAASAHLYQRIAAALLFPDRTRRGRAETMRANRHGQRGLWRFGISGDRPILLAQVTKSEHLSTVRELLTAQDYWRSHGLHVDLVILNDHPGSYLDAVQDQLVTLLNQRPQSTEGQKAGTYLLRGSQLLPEDRSLLEIAAMVVLGADDRRLVYQWDSAARRLETEPQVPVRSGDSLRPRRLTLSSSSRTEHSGNGSSNPTASPSEFCRGLEFWNGMGGFGAEGREYRIRLTSGIDTPMPWSNVLANPEFGTLVTERGGGYTWFLNSRENKLSSWSNDPVADPLSEAIFVQDELTGECTSPVAGLLRDKGEYWIHHGAGYTRFFHALPGLEQELSLSIAPDAPVKFLRLQLHNTSAQSRHLTVTCFVEWVLGVTREQSQLHIATEVDAQTGALFARNTYHAHLPHQVAFLHVLAGSQSVSGDRMSVIGRCRDLDHALAWETVELDGRTGVGLDPCGAVRTRRQIPSQARHEIIFLLGAGRDENHARALIAQYSGLSAVDEACTATVAQWDRMLESVQVATPNRALDLLVNRWLPYQTLSCRVWGRSALYQAGGAYGFRDQLQDVMALVYSRPDLVREHLLRAAGRQYVEGDVQHWWHPPEGTGTRTRFSDDFLWLPFSACHYVRTTGDSSVWEEPAGFLQSLPLEVHEQERYELPAVAAETASLYEHCRRAIQHGLRFGPHGLPLIGCGDWNDGMNRVGELGQGESVWVGWFLLVILREFIPVAIARGDTETASAYQQQADAIRHALEQQAWDGHWYRRAYFDDGTPLGSAQNDECQIDSIAQTWAVFAGADPDRCREAIQSVMERLVRPGDRLVLLFEPPFDRGQTDPGYIKGYLPGIRENGGQYTHPAMWLIEALARQGASDEAVQLFDLLNPIHHAADEAGVLQYQVEPYVVAADVYGVAPHTGRGGWTWYTGSASWMYRVALETLLGFRWEGSHVSFTPRLPATWPGFELTFRRQHTSWKFLVRRRAADSAAPTPSEPQELPIDGASHTWQIDV